MENIYSKEFLDSIKSSYTISTQESYIIFNITKIIFNIVIKLAICQFLMQNSAIKYL